MTHPTPLPALPTLFAALWLSACGTPANSADDPKTSHAGDTDSAGEGEAGVTSEEDSSGGISPGGESSGRDTADGGGEDGIPTTGSEDTGAPLSPCLGSEELIEVELEFTRFRVFDEEEPAPFDPEMGSFACYRLVVDSEGRTDTDTGSSTPPGAQLRLVFGPVESDGPLSSLRLTVGDGIRSYDLEADAGVPGSAEAGPIELSFTQKIGDATTAQWGSAQQGGTGTVVVTDLPDDGGSTFAFTAKGEIAGEHSLAFDLSFSAVLGT